MTLRSFFKLFGLIYLAFIFGCRKVPEGISVLNGRRLEIKILVLNNGQTSTIPFVLRKDEAASRAEMKAILDPLFRRLENGVSPDISLQIVEHPEPPSGMTKSLQEKHDSNQQFPACDG